MINQTFPTLNVKETGIRIKSLRVSNGYSVEEVACYMGFTGPQAVYKWEWGRSLPTVDNLFALSRLYGVAIEEILVGNDEYFSLYRKVLRTSLYNKMLREDAHSRIQGGCCYRNRARRDSPHADSLFFYRMICY